MFKIMFKDGVTIIDDEDVAKNIIKNLKKINNVPLIKQLTIYTSENGSYDIDDLKQIKVSKMTKNEEKILKNVYPFINSDELNSILIDSISQNSNKDNTIDEFFKSFEKGKNSDILNSLELNDDF